MEIEQAKREILSRHQRSGDVRSVVWLFPDHRPSMVQQGHKMFGHGKHEILLIDPFGGKEPFCLNYRSVTAPNTVAFRPTVLLDSQLVSELRGFLNPHSNTPPHQRRPILELLDWLVSKNWDYNPLFYAIETLAKHGPATARSHLERTSAAILTLHTLDVDHFQRHGCVVTDKTLLAPHQDQYGKKEIPEIAAAKVDHLLQDGADWLKSLTQLLDLTYCALLKIALLGADKRLPVLGKDAELRTFLADRVGISMGREYALGVIHFARRSNGFLKFERTMGMDGIRNAIRGSAWDLFLLRFPEHFLVNASPDGVVLAYPCTIDKGLQAVVQTTRLHTVAGLTPDPHVPLSTMVTDLSSLVPFLGDSVVTDLVERDRGFRSVIEGRQGLAYSERLRCDPDELVQQMEADVRRFWGFPA